MLIVERLDRGVRKCGQLFLNRVVLHGMSLQTPCPNLLLYPGLGQSVTLEELQTAASTVVSLDMRNERIKILKQNTVNTNAITFDGEALEEVKIFIYLVKIIDEEGRSDADVNTRIGKSRPAFLELKKIWNSKQLLTKIKVSIFNTDVKTVSYIVESRNLQNYRNHHQNGISIYKQFFAQDTQYPIVGYHQQ